MRRDRFNWNFAIVTALVGAVIIYACLYPFAFRQPAGGIGPIRRFVARWADWHGTGDFLSNVMLYPPLGFFAVLPNRSDRGSTRVAAATLSGGALCIAVELAEYYDKARSTDAIDFYSNLLGTLLGAAGAGIAERYRQRPLLREITDQPVAALLLFAWFGYRLFPTVPAINLARSWRRLQLIILHPDLAGYSLLRATGIWLAAGLLVEAVFGAKKFRLLFPLLVGAALVVEALIAPTTLRLSDLAGAAFALVCLLFSGPGRLRIPVVALLLTIAVLDPLHGAFQSGAGSGHFNWMPFRGFMQGSQRDLASFLQKTFVYGSLIWLLAETGLRLLPSTAVVAAILFIAASARFANADRDVTDTVIAIVTGAVLILVKSGPSKA